MKHAFSIASTLFLGLALSLSACGNKKPAATEPAATDPAKADPAKADPAAPAKPDDKAADDKKGAGGGGW